MLFEQELDHSEDGEAGAQGRGRGCSLTVNGPPPAVVSQGLIHSVPAEFEESAFSVCLRLNTRIPES